MYCRINPTVPVLDRYFNGQDTKTDFRLGREALAVLLDLLGQERRHGWGATIETLVFLFWLASGTSYRVVSRVFGMPRSTVHRIVHRVTEEVVAIRHKVIHLPKTPEDLVAVTNGFAGLARHRAFGKAAGAIDGCHVRIKPPSGPDGHCYRNRKLFSSIILQAVCDHQGRFLDTYVGWPGSVHDSRVLRHSPLYRSLYPPPGHFILADGGYPLPPTPTTPHHSLQEASVRCGSPALQLASFQGTLHYRACFWNDEDQVQGHLPASAGGAPHLRTSRHNSMCHPPQHLPWGR
ncbi:uncharacterized protein LOC130374536 [Gadus chalcogrammus]|uniref:uncharacterized protein LOC130374536 n=1 Tax=Gadus chalcogrammus TaxID=1042646 RepID=UPI0024C2A6F4|nr:uncharacterized protein LOC130374536 [Gadus chalcogrammus]